MSDYLMVSKPIAKKTCVIFLVIDTYDNTAGEKIKTINKAVPEIINRIKNVGNDFADYILKIATLSFNETINWDPPFPVELDDYIYEELPLGKKSLMGKAFSELASKLSKDSFLYSRVGVFAPVIILLSDGKPTDDYKFGFETLKQNKWYRHAYKIAFAIGEDANKDILAEFTGNHELVWNVLDIKLLEITIRRLLFAVS